MKAKGCSTKVPSPLPEARTDISGGHHAPGQWPQLCPPLPGTSSGARLPELLVWGTNGGQWLALPFTGRSNQRTGHCGAEQRPGTEKTGQSGEVVVPGIGQVWAPSPRSWEAPW